MSDTSLVRQIDSVVQSANSNPVWKGNAMGLITMEERMMLERQFGYEDGREEGEAEGEARFAALADRLLANDQIDELKRAATDPAFREKLFKEYAI